MWDAKFYCFKQLSLWYFTVEAEGEYCSHYGQIPYL